jgi:uncharacterized membrane protein|tara:strand:- start:436 stop:810 length:375 start_codon:yes stop_codon:yes gene_type:complete
MKKLIIGVALATSISTVALAAEEAVTPVLSNIDMSFVTDTKRNTTQGTTDTKFGVVAGVKGLNLSLLPKYSWTDSEVSNVEFGAGYTVKVNDTISIVPYGEINTNRDLDVSSKIIGIKTKFNFN